MSTAPQPETDSGRRDCNCSAAQPEQTLRRFVRVMQRVPLLCFMSSTRGRHGEPGLFPAVTVRTAWLRTPCGRDERIARAEGVSLSRDATEGSEGQVAPPRWRSPAIDGWNR